MLSNKHIMVSLLVLPLAACGDNGGADGDGTETEGDTSPTTTSATTVGSATADPDGSGTDAGTTSTATADPDTGSSTDGTETEGGSGGVIAVWATANPAGLDADRVANINPALDDAAAPLSVLSDVSSIESIALDEAGNGWVTFDGPEGGGLMVVDGLGDATEDAAIGLGDRVISGPATDLVTPKGLMVVEALNLVLVADTGAGDIKGFALDAEGDVAPVVTIDDLGGSPSVWDVHYDATSDALYAAATNGDVQVFDDFEAELGASGPDRTIVPTEGGKAITLNLHGIQVVGDTLFASDVGDPMSATDGQVLVIDGAGSADGAVDVEQRIQGNSLGNPVDLAVLDGGAIGNTVIYVAEKSNGAVLTFVQPALGGDFAFGEQFEAIAAESVALVETGLIASSNPAGRDADAALVLDDPALGGLELTATLGSLGSVSSIESILLRQNGDALITFDGPAVSGGGGMFVVAGLGALGRDGTVSAVASRVWGPNTGIVAPKGLDANADGSLVFIADFGAGDIKVFSDVTGNVAPLYVIADVGASPVWDVDYDDASDRLYAAGTDGTVRVFDDLSGAQGEGGPDRVISPTDGEAAIGVNLHGIVYDAATDNLLVTDVGDAASAEDGQIFVIPAGSSVDGSVEVSVFIGGDGTRLGNPVDIAFDGVDAYVAEKSNSRVLRYDAIFDLSGAQNVAEDASFELENPESVQLQSE